MKARDLTTLAIEWMRRAYPDSLIMTELSIADWRGAILDVAAITPTHIVGIEVKGEGDSASRLPLQGCSYPQVAREMWLLPSPETEAKIRPHKPRGWSMLEVWEGEVRPRNRAIKYVRYEEKPGHTQYRAERDDSRYEPDIPRRLNGQTPTRLCGALWRDELYKMARDQRLKPAKRALVGQLTKDICESLPVNLIHDQMIALLRQRNWPAGKVIRSS